MKVRLNDGAFMPERAHAVDAGLDLRTPVDAVIESYGDVEIDTGVAVQIPEGYVGLLLPKSGLNVNYGVWGEGVIDAGYTGTIHAKLYNQSGRYHKFERGDKIIQLVVVPCMLEGCELVEDLGETERGTGGFGSTGR